ncbi:AAA family ATPase [Ruminococcaceae bacterium OttesenSCG-928-A16]|nr:AAA family ATPase [Ruminococcaceae bacterium OttesenSCG-928-A16]
MDALIIAFVSGKGGTGKSTTSVLVGGALAALGKSVLLIELDSGLRSVDIIAGVSGQTVYDIEDVLSGRCEPNKAIVQSSAYNGLSVISAPYAGGVITTKNLRVLCNKMRPHFDYILIDTAAGLGAAYSAATAVAHRVVLVLTADPVALRDGRLVTDELGAGETGTVRLILNKVNPQQILNSGVLRDLDEAIDIVGARLLGVIPDSGAILKAGATGTPLPKNSVEKQVFDAIAHRIAGHDVPLVIR